MRDRYRQMPVHIINNAVNHEFSHQYSENEKKKIETYQDPENLIGHYLFEFDFKESDHFFLLKVQGSVVQDCVFVPIDGLG